MLTVSSARKVWWSCEHGHPSWKATITSRSNGSSCPYCTERLPIVGANDLATLRPDLVVEWDFEKNGNLTPAMFTLASNKKIFWRCPQGHPSWEATIVSRSHGAGCPYCSCKLPIPGVNDFATLRPRLVDEWDYKKNRTLTPSMFSVFSNKKVWWHCKYGHPSWKATITSRSNGSGCPYCAEHIPIQGSNDLATLRPDLAAEWDFEKNRILTPSMVTVSSDKKVFWKCSKEHHSWNSSVASRSNGSGCPVCAGHIPIPGVNDLATLRPDLAAEWDFEENGDLIPSMFTVFSSIKVRWRCKIGHSWRTSISSRSNGSGCPYCRGFRKLPYPTSKTITETTGTEKTNHELDYDEQQT